MECDNRLSVTLEKGARLGPYEILEPLGAGGMGEVFRARDTRLDRSVAIKVLPSHLAFSPQLRERFDREARAISAVNHPNICTLYDVGQHDGIDYIVMELLEGETLADRLRKGPLPLEQVLRYGAQIAEGLDKAHRLGIVHRDLKPGNVMITKSGAKLLDFGLAKGVQRNISPDAPTEHHKPLTAEGTIVGTFQYMAPEQLSGDDADPRSDIFALGAVLYEMATARRAFDGKTKTSLIAAIVSSEPPPLSQVQPLTPAALEHVIRKCLAKDPEERWQSAHDIASELRWIAGSSGAALPASHASAGRGIRRSFLLSAVMTGFVAAVALALLWNHERSLRPSMLVTASINVPAGWEYSLDGGLAISPDGAYIAFANKAVEEKSRKLHIRNISTAAMTSIPGSEGAEGIFWSPDSRNVGFFAGGKLMRAALSGGGAQTICDAESPRGGTWSKDGTIVFTPVFRDGLFRVSSGGGEVKRVTQPDTRQGETNHRWPHFLPDGEHLLFLAQRGEGGIATDRSTIEVLSLKTGARKQIIRGNSSMFYSAGHILYWREQNLFAREFDTRKLEVRGDPFVVATDAAYSGNESVVASAAENGSLVYVVANTSRVTKLVWMDRTGRELVTVAEGALGMGMLSHDGGRVAVGIAEGTYDIWTFDTARKTRSRITNLAGGEYAPIWSPDDSRIAYASAELPLSVYVVPATGGKPQRLFSGENPIPRDWSRDDVMLIEYNDSKLKWGIGVYSIPERKFTSVVQTPANDGSPVFSPDGKWFAYMSDQTGRHEVYVHALATGQEWQISSDGGGFPQWSGDGGEIFYLTTGGRMMNVEVKLSPEFSAAEPKPLFDTSVAAGEDLPFDVFGRDRFIVNKVLENSTRTTATLIQNWTLIKK